MIYDPPAIAWGTNLSEVHAAHRSSYGAAFVRPGTTYIRTGDRCTKRPAAPAGPCRPETLGREEHLDDVLAGYGTDIDLDVIHSWWSLRSLLAVRWLIEHGFDPFAPGCEVDVLRSRM
ncbi:hypothetical protein ACFFMM_20575 [Micromonospora chaiyaphumensis]|uniref:hypothetical protein n=1 Tax=Micromonospora chaiyaphumensis TaxID=307119 RepID=UPI000B13DF5E|nr:hypothetical protein [Micromonospora chaiyaphumensis]